MNIYLSFLIIYFWTSLHTSNYVFFFVVCMFLLISIDQKLMYSIQLKLP